MTFHLIFPQIPKFSEWEVLLQEVESTCGAPLESPVRLAAGHITVHLEEPWRLKWVIGSCAA